MKITKQYLKQVIKEELEKVQNEALFGLFKSDAEKAWEALLPKLMKSWAIDSKTLQEVLKFKFESPAGAKKLQDLKPASYNTKTYIPDKHMLDLANPQEIGGAIKSITDPSAEASDANAIDLFKAIKALRGNMAPQASLIISKIREFAGDRISQEEEEEMIRKNDEEREGGRKARLDILNKGRGQFDGVSITTANKEEMKKLAKAYYAAAMDTERTKEAQWISDWYKKTFGGNI